MHYSAVYILKGTLTLVTICMIVGILARHETSYMTFPHPRSVAYMAFAYLEGVKPVQYEFVFVIFGICTLHSECTWFPMLLLYICTIVSLTCCFA